MTADFTAVDWGTSSFRLWLMDREGRVLAESRGLEGMQHCAAETSFADVLAAHLARVAAPADLPVLICGMAGARQGWFEAPYADLPARVDAIAAQAVRLPASLAGARDIRILPGLAQRDPAQPDVMRGEETQLMGLAMAGHEGLVCMPGTHCKWARLDKGAVTGFRSYMTGELFALLSRQSILRHAMPEAGRIDPANAAFAEAVDAALADPGMLAGALFPLRAAQLLDFAGRAETLAHLSGLLIGAEVGRTGESGGAVTLVGQEGLGALYAVALRRAGYTVAFAEADDCTRRGLLAAATEIWRFR